MVIQRTIVNSYLWIPYSRDSLYLAFYLFSTNFKKAGSLFFRLSIQTPLQSQNYEKNLTTNLYNPFNIKKFILTQP